MFARVLALLCLLLLLAWSKPVHAAQSYDNCTGFITSLPAVISTQGTWCLKQDLQTAVTSGNAITITTNNVTIDCNDFKIGGLAAGAGTTTTGISATNRSNLTVRHCNVRGFFYGLWFSDNGSGGGHVVEDNLFDGNTFNAINVGGDGSVIRRNRVTNTGGSTSINTSLTPFVVAISTDYNTDIIDNIVSGVAPVSSSNEYAVGITVTLNTNGRIIGNGISGLVHAGTGATLGILGTDVTDGRFIVRDNDLSGDNGAGSIGIFCKSGTAGAAKNNMTAGFVTAISNCADAGGNYNNP
jgi:hypothetical protein